MLPSVLKNVQIDIIHQTEFVFKLVMLLILVMSVIHLVKLVMDL